MCITSLPYCPRRISEKIPAIIESAMMLPSWDNSSDLASTYAAEPTALPECNFPSSPSIQSASTVNNPYAYGEFEGPGPAIAEDGNGSDPLDHLYKYPGGRSCPAPMSAAAQQDKRHFTAPSISSPSPFSLRKRRATAAAQTSVPQIPPANSGPAGNWFLCTRLTSGTVPSTQTLTKYCSPDSQPEAHDRETIPDRPTHPANCPALEIRHPSFNGAECARCTEAARRLCGMKAAEQDLRDGQKEALRQEIHRTEQVVENMKRKLATLEKGIFCGENGPNGDKKKGFKTFGDRKSEWYGHGGMI